MKKIILTLVIITIIGFFFGLIPECFAAGSQPAPGDECCVVVNPGNAAMALKGTIALEYTYEVVSDEVISNLDVLLRLTKGQGGDAEFFRLNLLGEDFRLLTDPSILCLILNPKESEVEGNGLLVTEFVNQVLKAFFGSDTELNAENTRLVITENSISDGQGVFGCDEPEEDPNVQVRDTKLCEVPGTNPPRIFSMASVTVYVVSLDKINFLYPSCAFQGE